MERYFLSETFTLIPKELYTPQCGEEALNAQFSLKGSYIYKDYCFESAGAVIAFAIKKENNENGASLPFVVKLLEESLTISNYNRVVFHYSKERKLAHIIICTGEELKLANSFKADSFESALYFLFLSIQQLQMNPKQCIVRVCSEIESQQEDTIKRFFNGVETNNLSNLIQQ